jgi:putative heme-binding domain-containing protein
VEKWVTTLDKKDPGYEHNLLEALWLHQAHNVVNEGLLRRMLRSPDFRARAAATHVLCYWRDRVPQALELLRQQINDDSPRVRLEAIRALSFFHTDDALGVAVELLAHPDDEYLRFVFNETLNTLERRLGQGRLNRKNIASSLLHMLRQGKVAPERRPVLLETVCRHGGPEELRHVWEEAARPGTYPPALRRRVLDWLAEAARTRRIRPAALPADVGRLLDDASHDAALLPGAVRLAVAWKVKEAAAPLEKIARDGNVKLDARIAAMDGLATLDGSASRKTLQELAGPPSPVAVRFHAAAALARVDLEAAARAAAAALAASAEADDPAVVVDAFLVRKGGPDRLAAALGRQKMAADAAKRVLRAMYLAGRNDAPLSDVVGRLAGVDAAPKPPTPHEVRKIAAEVLARGDAARGEQVFRRADLGCIKCHAINKAGGHIGPDLGPIGGSSPLDYIITSVLDPNASIKEEYLTKVISTTAGQVYTGIVARRGKNEVVLKDATGKLIAIPTAEIDEEAKGKSLMPEGITRILTHAELLDLLRFVSELGKPGPFAIPAQATVQRWRRLREVPPSLAEGVPNRDVLRDTVLRAGPEAWDAVYSRVNGTLPLNEDHKLKPGEVVYLQGDVQVVQGGPVEVRVQVTAPAVFWVDEEPFEKQDRAVLTLSPGRHRITVRVAPGNTPAPRLRVELRRPADSHAHFDVVTAD